MFIYFSGVLVSYVILAYKRTKRGAPDSGWLEIFITSLFWPITLLLLMVVGVEIMWDYVRAK